MFGHDAARFISKHCSSKKERLKINSKINMELSDWFKGFEKGIARLSPEQRAVFFSECGKTCVNGCTLSIYRKLYEDANGDMDVFLQIAKKSPLAYRHKKKSPPSTWKTETRNQNSNSKKWQLPTLPLWCVVPSAVPDLTALFGMGRGGTPALKLPQIS